MKACLVIMAAGMGSRYGGNKQVDGVGPHNEILMEYSIYDAIRAGFGRIVFIIKPDMQDLMEEICGRYLRTRTAGDGTAVEVEYAFQDFTSIPKYYTIPEGRTKPFGTIHAVLCAKNVVDGPFCVLNADDYYGVDAFAAMYQELMQLPQEGKATMVGYELAKTASVHGTVSRGICTVQEDVLCTLKETLKIQLFDDGTLQDLDTETILSPNAVVSMNYWGFQPSIFKVMEDYFEQFLRLDAGENQKAECLLPVMVGKQVSQGILKVSVLRSTDCWFGMTYQEDRMAVAKELEILHEAGVYPVSLKG